MKVGEKVGEYQLEFYEQATLDEIKRAKSLLSRYRRRENLITEMEQIEVLSEKQKLKYNTYNEENKEIERSIRLILNPEIRRAIELRFIEGIRRKDALFHFKYIDPSTFDRWILKGIESVANSLKEFE